MIAKQEEIERLRRGVFIVGVFYLLLLLITVGLTAHKFDLQEKKMKTLSTSINRLEKKIKKAETDNDAAKSVNIDKKD